ncbi:MAG: SsrA-binding protein SmpB [Bacilli bacterium]|nr:SsrA-binding protein SmpB [Bacilli bacterium]
MEIVNRKASFLYFIEDTYEAGIVLKGTEIKSIRKGEANLKDSYVIIRNNEAYILNMFISKYEEGNINNHEETRNRKLLLNKQEIMKLKSKINIEGYTIVPLKVYIKRDNAKVLIGVGKGKKIYDKRESIKQKDIERNERKATNYF